MKKMFALIVVVLAFFLGTLAGWAEKAPQKIVDLANNTLAQTGSDAVIVAAVKSENAKGKTLEAIKAMDEEWKNTAGINATMKELMENPCAERLKEFFGGKGFFAEAFVMDDKGANVCMTAKTSDYWQGDEPKFQKSFADGKGAIFVDEVEFDDSSQAYLVQISVPVMDEGKAIGAITYGIDLDQVE